MSRKAHHADRNHRPIRHTRSRQDAGSEPVIATADMGMDTGPGWTEEPSRVCAMVRSATPHGRSLARSDTGAFGTHVNLDFASSILSQW